jgi:hypothetical protein
MYELFLNFLNDLKTEENEFLLEQITQGFSSSFSQSEPNNVWNDTKIGKMGILPANWSSQPSGSGDEYFPSTTIKDPQMKKMVQQSKMGYRIGVFPKPRMTTISLKDLGIHTRGGYNVNGVQGGMPGGNSAGYSLGGPLGGMGTSSSPGSR